jgi:hypothetical protein
MLPDRSLPENPPTQTIWLEIIAVDAGIQRIKLSLRQPVGSPDCVTDVPGSDREELVAGSCGH